MEILNMTRAEMFIPDLGPRSKFFPSRIQGSKKHWIPDPDLHYWKILYLGIVEWIHGLLGTDEHFILRLFVRVHLHPVIILYAGRLNMELGLQSLFGLHVHSCTHWLRPRHTPYPPTPSIWALIRGRYWSAKLDDISLWPPVYTVHKKIQNFLDSFGSTLKTLDYEVVRLKGYTSRSQPMACKCRHVVKSLNRHVLSGTKDTLPSLNLNKLIFF